MPKGSRVTVLLGRSERVAQPCQSAHQRTQRLTLVQPQAQGLASRPLLAAGAQTAWMSPALQAGQRLLQVELPAGLAAEAGPALGIQLAAKKGWGRCQQAGPPQVRASRARWQQAARQTLLWQQSLAPGSLECCLPAAVRRSWLGAAALVDAGLDDKAGSAWQQCGQPGGSGGLDCRSCSSAAQKAELQGGFDLPQAPRSTPVTCWCRCGCWCCLRSCCRGVSCRSCRPLTLQPTAPHVSGTALAWPNLCGAP